MDLQGAGVDLVIILAFLFVGWYIVGAQWQRRVALAYVRTLGEAARTLARDGRAPNIKWLGSSGFQLLVPSAVDPFTKLSIVTLLAPREALALWLVAVARRRGDRVVVRADLAQRPRVDVPPHPGNGPIGEVSFSRESPHVIATLDAAWLRSREPSEIAQAIREAARPG